jgi:uncharacterized protein HemX
VTPLPSPAPPVPPAPPVASKAPAPTPAPVTAVTPTAPVSAPPVPKRSSSWRERGPFIAAGVAALALVVVLVAAYLPARSKLSDTRGELRRAQAELTAANKKAEQAANDLTTRTAERDALQLKYDDVAGQLNGAQSSLASSQDRIANQAGQIDVLKSCLNGVATALSYIAEDDYISAGAALDAVEVSCETAESLF